MEACTKTSEATSAAWDAHVSAYERQAGLLRAGREKLTRGYEELKEEQDSLVHENEGTDVSDADLLKINAGGRAVTATRRTLTQVKGSRLEALFSGRWEKRLLRDEDGRIFLDVNPDCFQALVDCLNEKRITPPDVAVDPPEVGKDNEVYLERLLSSLGMDDDLAFSASRGDEPLDDGEASAEDWENLTFDEFPEKLQSHLKAEQGALVEAKKRLSEQRWSFHQEKLVLNYFVGGETKDIVWLDVSGVLMAVKRSTLSMREDSVLAKQFNDPLWEQKDASEDHSPAVEDWTPEEVEAWANTIKGLTVEASAILRSNDIGGVHLLAMRRDDFRDMGMKAGVLAVLTNAIQELQKSNKPGPTFIEHSSYCFGKLVDQLRIRAMQQPHDSYLPKPRVNEREQKRFETVVGYYFPGDSAAFILESERRVETETDILTKSHIDKIYTWLEEDGIEGDLDLLYRASDDGWMSSDFHSNCDGKGSTLTVVRTTDGYIFGGFADVPWSSGNKRRLHVSSPKAFLFALLAYAGAGPTKLRQYSRGPHATVTHSASYGPTFGGGNDLVISSSPNHENSCSASLGNDFSCPNSHNGQPFFAPRPTFTVAELEVFRVG